MSEREGNRRTSRREFIKRAASMGGILCLEAAELSALRWANMALRPGTLPAFQARTVSAKRLPELKAWMEKLDRSGRLSANKTWRRYIGSFQYQPPGTLASARSLIVLAVPLKISRIAFHAGGQRHSVPIPCGYVDDGLKLADYRDMLFAHGVVPRDSRLEMARLPLKQLAVRSGLAAYGRNNITFVDGYGSYHTLLAFYSELALEDHWGPLKLLRECKGCSICMKDCPTGAIRAGDFIIDPARCISLYNELPEPMPAWIPASAHHTLVGCLKCQLDCPGNEGLNGQFLDLGDVPEAETAALLSGRIDKAMALSLKSRLKKIGGGDDLAYMARNLKLVLDAKRAPEATSGPASKKSARNQD